MNNVVVKDYYVSDNFMILSGLNSYLSVFRIIYFSHFIVFIQFYLDAEIIYKYIILCKFGCHTASSFKVTAKKVRKSPLSTVKTIGKNLHYLWIEMVLFSLVSAKTDE